MYLENLLLTITCLAINSTYRLQSLAWSYRWSDVAHIHKSKKVKEQKQNEQINWTIDC